MHQDVAAADQMISRLSDLLRMTLESNGLQEVPLRRELEFLGGYVAIEQVRFRDRLRIVYDIDAETLDAHVPNMLLQPLVENSIRHGIALHSGKGMVELLSARLNGELRLLLRNTVPEPGERDGLPGFGVGLRNTRERLQQLYGDAHSFALRQNEDGVAEVEIRIPFTTEPRNGSTTLLTEPLRARRTLQQVGS
jgi:two-component system, LytTR family, sensor kinase